MCICIHQHVYIHLLAYTQACVKVVKWRENMSAAPWSNAKLYSTNISLKINFSTPVGLQIQCYEVQDSYLGDGELEGDPRVLKHIYSLPGSLHICTSSITWPIEISGRSSRWYDIQSQASCIQEEAKESAPLSLPPHVCAFWMSLAGDNGKRAFKVLRVTWCLGKQLN